MRKTFRSEVFMVMVLCVLALLVTGCAPDGSAVFKTECAGCHNFKGFGGSICPDLTNVTKTRSDDWIRQQLRDPSVNNPNTKMPSFERLSDKEVQALIDHFKS